MSYDVSVRCTHCNSALEKECLNYTYNLATMFQWALEGLCEGGLHGLHGKTGEEVEAMLVSAIDKCEADGNLVRFDAPNGWGDNVSALQFLRSLKNACADNPKGVVYVC